MPIFSLPVSWKREREQRVAGRDDHILLAFDHVRHRVRDNSASSVKIPEQFATSRVQREKVRAIAAEDKSASSGHEPGVRRRMQTMLPSSCAGNDVKGTHCAVRLLLLVLS